MGFQRNLVTNKCVLIKNFKSSTQVFDGGTNNNSNSQQQEEHKIFFQVGTETKGELCNLGQAEKHATR